MGTEQILLYLLTLGVGSVLGLIVITSYFDSKISKRRMIFEARTKAYAGITGRLFNLFLEPDIVGLKEEALIWAKLNALLSDVFLLGSNELVDLVQEYKTKVFEFHKSLRGQSNTPETEMLHKELVALSGLIFNQMRRDLSIFNKSVLETPPTRPVTKPPPSSEDGSAPQRRTLNDDAASFGSRDLSQQMREFLLAESSMLKKACQTGFSGRAKEISIVLASCCNNASAIATLGQEELYFYNEAIVLARAFVERVINFCYLLVCDESEYQNFLKYSLQKGYRKLDRHIAVSNKIVGIKYTGGIEPDMVPGLSDALKDFTSGHGREITHWTKASISDRLSVISQRTSINVEGFMVNMLSIYEDASEALHGTLYGVSFHTGAHQPGFDHSDIKAAETNNYRNWTLLHWGLGLMLDEVLQFLASSSDIAELASKSASNAKTFSEMMKQALDTGAQPHDGLEA